MRRLLPLPAEDVDDLWPLYALPPAPHVRAGFVTSLDGAVAVDGSARALSTDADRVALRTLRAAADVVLVGATTARREGYGPVPLPELLRRRRIEAGMTERPLLAVVSRTCDLAAAPRLLSGPPGAVAVVVPDDVSADVPDAVEVLRCGSGSGRDVLGALHERGHLRVLCEGGPTLLASLVDDRLVDELCLTTSPLLVGGQPGLLPGALAAPVPARLTQLVEADGTLLSRWSLR